jgi:hypothetical protein
MDIIQKLKYHESNHLLEWLESDEKTQKQFIKELLEFSKEHFDEIKDYCRNTKPSELSSLYIIYEAFSLYSFEYNEFLFEEIKRVVLLAKNKSISADCLSVLEDIEVEDIYLKQEPLYIEIMDFLTSQLHISNDEEFNYNLLDIIHWYLFAYDVEDQHPAAKVWMQRIEPLTADKTNFAAEIAKNILNDLNGKSGIDSSSFWDRIKKIFN